VRFLRNIVNPFRRESADGGRKKFGVIGRLDLFWNFRLGQFRRMEDMRLMLD
jgi:hypothetical protein